MNVCDYYERYWTDGQAGHHGEIMPGLERILWRYLKPGMRCLDVGSGDGHTAAPFVTSLGCTYTGADISQAAVDTALHAGRAVHKIDDAASLPFADASFDAAISLE